MHDQLLTFGRNGDFIRALVDHRVDFLVVGGLAVVFHGCRDEMSVDDLDLMLNPSKDNAENFIACLANLGLSVTWSTQDFSKPNVQLPIKRDFYLDILTPPANIEYEMLIRHALDAGLNKIPIKVVSREDLIALKRIAVKRQESEIVKHRSDLQCLEANL